MNTKTLRIDGYEIGVSNLDKELFPGDGITKRDLIEYYHKIADVALPHWQHRPATMQRFPDGIDQDGFFQKEVPDYFPEWIERQSLPTQDGRKTYPLIANPATLVYLANQGCITLHLGLSRVDRVDFPDRLIFDLDPSNGDFAPVQEVARRVREMLEALELDSYVQTTGSRGLHILVPLDRSAKFNAVRDFAHRVSRQLAMDHQEQLTVEQRKSKRGGRVYLDYLRNAYGQTSVAPYAVRPLQNAPVATPLEWEEALAHGMTAQKYNIGNIFRRLGQKSDPWESLNRVGKAIAPAADKLAALGGS